MRDWFPLLVMLVTSLPSLLAGSEVRLSAARQVVLLRNGYVLEGRVTPLGDHYLLTLGNDNEVRLPADRVAMVCRDLEEAYQRQRVLSEPADVRDHVKLADWCLRYELTARAADQILAVFALDPTHPDLAALESRLRHRATDQRRPDIESAQRQPPTPIADTARPAALPPDALRRFTTTVQPLLMNRCATNACHGAAAATEFRLLRPAFGQPMTQRMTHRNLQSVLAQVDRLRPERSPLLALPRQPHGGNDEPVFGAADDAALTTLAGWVELLAESAENVPSVVAVPQSSLWQTGSQRGPARPPDPREARSPQSQGETGVVVTPAVPAPQDPFDPDIFHRRHAAERAPIDR